MSVRKYTWIFVLLVALIASLLSAVNYVIDPYMLFQSVRVPHFNDKKPTAAGRSRLYKPYNVISIRPQTIIVGNSRPEMGLDPKSTCWPPESGIVYNMTFPGLGPYAQVRALFHAVEVGEVKNILLGVDFADFLDERSKTKTVYWPKQNSDFFDRLLVDELFQENKGYWLSKIKDFTTALFSLNALNDSIYTLLSQTSNSSNRTYLGFNTSRDYYEIIRYEGVWVLFEQAKMKLEKRFSKTGLSIFDSKQWSVELEAIKRAVQLSVEKNIQLTIFINPYHYTYLETIHKTGYWSAFEHFKKSLKNIMNQYGKGKVKLWDFALYSKYTVSPVPRKNIDTVPFQWFWEPAHYKAELGDVMLADIFGLNCIKDHMDPVGINLKNLNIDSHLLQQKEQRLVMLRKINAENP